MNKPVYKGIENAPRILSPANIELNELNENDNSAETCGAYNEVMKQNLVWVGVEFFVGKDDVQGVVDEVADRDTNGKIGESASNKHHVAEQVGSITDAFCWMNDMQK